jgi:hypothetical protein
VFLVSCSTPGSKDAYFDKFEKFIQRVEEDHADYNKKDWEWADSRFEKFNTEWYEKYKDDFTTEEQIEVKTLVVKYYSMKSKKGLGRFLKDLFKDVDLDGIDEDIQEYIDNNLDDDIDELIDGVTGITDSVINVLDNVVESLNK